MNPFAMRGRWGRLTGWMYEAVVGAGAGELYDRFADEVAREARDGWTVLDVGCGQGQIAARLADRLPRCQVIGLDLSPDMIRRARAAEEPAGRDNLELRVGDALAIPFDDDAIDAAVSVASIKHWPDRKAGVAEMVRVVKPGRPVVVLECERGCSWEEAARFVSSWRHPVPGASLFETWYFRQFVAGQALTLDELAGVLTRAGARDVEVWREEGLPFVVGRGRAPESPR